MVVAERQSEEGLWGLLTRRTDEVVGPSEMSAVLIKRNGAYDRFDDLETGTLLLPPSLRVSILL